VVQAFCCAVSRFSTTPLTSPTQRCFLAGRRHLFGGQVAELLLEDLRQRFGHLQRARHLWFCGHRPLPCGSAPRRPARPARLRARASAVEVDPAGPQDMAFAGAWSPTSVEAHGDDGSPGLDALLHGCAGDFCYSRAMIDLPFVARLPDRRHDPDRDPRGRYGDGAARRDHRRSPPGSSGRGRYCSGLSGLGRRGCHRAGGAAPSIAICLHRPQIRGRCLLWPGWAQSSSCARAARCCARSAGRGGRVGTALGAGLLTNLLNPKVGVLLRDVPPAALRPRRHHLAGIPVLPRGSLHVLLLALAWFAVLIAASLPLGQTAAPPPSRDAEPRPAHEAAFRACRVRLSPCHVPAEVALRPELVERSGSARRAERGRS